MKALYTLVWILTWFIAIWTSWHKTELFLTGSFCLLLAVLSILGDKE